MLHRPQKFQHTLPREHRNTPWAEHSRADEPLLVAIVCVLTSIAVSLLLL